MTATGHKAEVIQVGSIRQLWPINRPLREALHLFRVSHQLVERDAPAFLEAHGGMLIAARFVGMACDGGVAGACAVRV